MKSKCFVYGRISTDDKGQEVENQLRELRKFAERQGWDIAHEYIDQVSGSRSNRTQLEAMMLAASQRKADVVLFWSLDRLSREGAFQTLRYLNLLTSYCVAFRSFTEPYLDSCGVFKEAVISILATIAKQERIRMGERVKAGMARAREKGARFGRPRHGADVRQIARLRRSGASLREIGKRVGISEASVRRSLKWLAMRQKAVRK